MTHPSHVTVRQERAADQRAIHALITAAFAGQPFADGDEQDLVDALREIGALTLSLVAELDGTVVGHIAFSPSRNHAQAWYALGPVAVDPKYQRRGIGRQLIKAGLAALHEAGAHGCFLTGNPDYYRRFGFNLAPDSTPAAESADYYMLKFLNASQPPREPIEFHDAFYAEHAHHQNPSP